MSISKYIYIFALVSAAILVAAFELHLLPSGTLLADSTAAYWLSIVGVVLTLVCIPLALKWSKIGFIARLFAPSESHLADKASRRSDLTRIAVLFLPLLFNIFCYYLLGCEASFAYMALMLLVAFAYIWPR